MKKVMRALVIATVVSFGTVAAAQAQVKDAWITAKTKVDLMTTEGEIFQPFPMSRAA